MFRIEAPILIVPTLEAKQALGRRLRWAGLAAYREIAVAAKGLEIAHLQFAFFDLTLAVCSRIRRDGLVEIEIGLGNPRLPARSFTAAQIREALRSRETAGMRAPVGPAPPHRVTVMLTERRQHPPMRYAPSERLFRLARLLAGTLVGLTLDEIAAALGIKRRTAERLRDTLEATFPELRHHVGDSAPAAGCFFANAVPPLT